MVPPPFSGAQRAPGAALMFPRGFLPGAFLFCVPRWCSQTLVPLLCASRPRQSHRRCSGRRCRAHGAAGRVPVGEGHPKKALG